MADILAEMSCLDAIHVVSHGSSGRIAFWETLRSQDTLAQYQSQLASATGADVAASTDFTGNTLLGGNWQLETATGVIEANALNGNLAGMLAIIRRGNPSRG